MIARVWQGWTTLENADAYERLLREQVIPELRRPNGIEGAYIFRQEGNDEVAFLVITFFATLGAVQAFAGSDYSVPVFHPDARRLLSKIEPLARHYEVRLTPE